MSVTQVVPPEAVVPDTAAATRSNTFE